MAGGAWKKPFYELGNNLRSLINEDLKLFHANLMTPFDGAEESKNVIPYLEPALDGYSHLTTIETPTRGCEFHAHIFFGDQQALDSLRTLIRQLPKWLKDVPPGLLPDYELPQTLDRFDRPLILWSNVVYFLAWEFDQWYLDASVEYHMGYRKREFDPWIRLRRPMDANPRPILTHEQGAIGSFEAWPARFAREECTLPPAIDAFLLDVGNNICGEFLRATAAAADIIAGILELKKQGKRHAKPVERRRTSRTKAQRIEDDNFELMLCLLSHDMRKRDTDVELGPLRQTEIAQRLKWVSKNTGRPNQSKVSKRMDRLFPRGGQKQYLSMFSHGETYSYLKRLFDQSMAKKNIHSNKEAE